MCQVQTRLGDLERATGDLAAADARLCGVLARAGAVFAETDETVLAALVALGTVHTCARRYDDAEAAYLRALGIVEAQPVPDPAELAIAAAGTASLTAVRGPGSACAAAAVLGLGVSIAWPAQDALLAAIVPAPARSAAFTLRYTTMNAELGAGALLAAVLIDVEHPASFTVAYLLDAATYLAFVPVLLLAVPAARPTAPTTPGAPTAPDARSGGYRVVFADRVFRRVWLLTALVVAVSYGQFHATFPAYATGAGGIGTHALGLAYAANSIAVVAAGLPALRLLAGRRRSTAIALAAAGFALTWAITLAAGHAGGGPAAAAGFITAMVVFALAETAIAPTLPAIVNDLADAHDEGRLRGRYNGAATLAWTTGFLLGPAIGGLALSAGLGQALFLGLIGGCALAMVGAARLEPHLPAAAKYIDRRI